jgi:RNA polymerase sigma factor (sigma-70 family)
MSNSLILIADNDKVNLKIMQDFLRREGYSTVTATDIASARRALQNRAVDLAILDIRLDKDQDERDKSGLRLAQAMAPELPKIIYTKFPTYENVREAFLPDMKRLPPATDFVAKQEGLPLLLSSVKNALKTVDNNKLLRELQKGDAKAWRGLWEQEGWRLIAIGRHYGLTEDEAIKISMDIFRDLAQDTTPLKKRRFALKRAALRSILTDKVVEKIKAFRRGKGPQTKTPRRRGVGRDKAATIDQRLLADIATPAITNNISQDAFVRQLSGAIKELPPRQQKVIELRLFQGTPTADIAEKLGVTEKTVGKHLDAALVHLRNKVAELGGK